MGGLGLLLVFIVLLLLGQGFSILLGLTVERYTSHTGLITVERYTSHTGLITVERYTSHTGLITFIAFALFWFAWKVAVWLTEPGKRIAKLLSGAAEQRPK